MILRQSKQLPRHVPCGTLTSDVCNNIGTVTLEDGAL